MEVAFYLNTRRAAAQGKDEWIRQETWMAADHCPHKGELVEVTVTANDGALVQREMRVVEVCHTGPRSVKVYLIPTYLKT